MAYTTGNNFTVGAGFTTGKDLTISSFLLTVPLTFKNYETYSLSVPLTFTQYESYTLTVPITFNVVFALNVPITFGIYEGLTLSAGISFTTYETYGLTVPLTFTQYETYGLTVPLTFVNFELYTLEAGINFHVFWFLEVPLTFTQYETYNRSVPLTFSLYESYGLSVATSIEVLSNYWTLGFGVDFINFETYLLTIPTSIEVTAIQYGINIPVTFITFENLSLTIPLRIEILPTITSGVGEQGVGGVVVNPADYMQLWSVKVTLNGVDVSSRLTDTVTVDAEESSAAVAVFSLRANSGFIDPYAWSRKPVTIEYVAKDTEGVVTHRVLLFKGLVDTPIYDTMTRTTQFNCTDNLQNAVSKLSKSAIDALTPLAKWSRFVFDENAIGWDYLQQRLSTYHYSVGLDTNGRLQVRDWQSGAIKYEFNNSTIIDGSLSLTIANARDLVNSVTVSLSASTELYRESVLSLKWTEEAWFTNSYLNWFPCSVQMICDAVANAGASFVNVPYFNMTPQSQWRHGPGSALYGFLNPGTELNCIEFSAVVSKRWKQSVSNVSRVVVQSLDSIREVGTLPEAVEGSVASQYNSTIEDFFMQSQSMNWFQSSAGTGLSQGGPTWDILPGTPLLAQGDGFASYPMIGFTFQTYLSSQSSLAGMFGYDALTSAYQSFYKISGTKDITQTINAYQAYQSAANTPRSLSNINLAQYDHIIRPSESGAYTTTYDITGAPGGHGLPGEHVYDFDSFLVQGNAADRQASFEVLKAQGITKVLASHRQNRVGFKTILNPQVKRGDTIRVSTSTLKARGVVHQVTHSFDIQNGLADTFVNLAISTPKSMGIVDGQVSGLVLRIPVVFEVGISLTPVGAARLPVTHGAFSHDITLPCHYYSAGEPDPSWTGHISPRNYIGSNEFVVTFPGIPTQDTENAEVISESPAYNVSVPHDELLILA